MNIRHIFVMIAAVLLTSAVLADSSSVTSKKYVDDFMAGYQNKIPGSGADKLMIYDDTDGIGAKDIVSSLGVSTSATDVPNVGAVKAGIDGKQDTINGTAGYVMTGTGYDGTVGEAPIYGTSSQYSSALVTAETVNTAVTNAVNGSLIRVDENGAPSNTGTLWEIVDDLTALNVCSNYTPATGTVVQNGTPTPTNPVLPTFYQQGDMILRSVGTYADSYDATTNKITRRVGVKVLDGTESWTWTPSSAWKARLAISTIVMEQDKNPPLLCNMFMPHSWNAPNISQPQISILSSGSAINFTMGWDTNITTFADWKQYLSDQYAAGTPVVVYYPLATPVEESMPPRCQ